MSIFPNEMESECLVCGKRITYAFPLCAEHFKEYGCKPKEWQPWLREMWNMRQKSRRAEIKARKHEVSLSLLEENFPFL